METGVSKDKQTINCIGSLGSEDIKFVSMAGLLIKKNHIF